MFQSHLMEVIESLLEKKTTYSLKETRDLLSLYIPLTNKRLLPISSDMVKPNTARKKFSYLDDHLLLTGLEEFGYQKISQIQAKWLPKKTEKEIKHRYKNLICLKAPDNIIKGWKKMSDEPLNKIEQEKLLKGVSWFGKKKWALISKYMCLNRPPEQLAKIYAQLMNSQYPGKLAAKAKQKPTKESLPNIMDYISQKPIDDNWNDITIEDIKEGDDSDIFSTCSLNI